MTQSKAARKAVFCIPTLSKPHPATLDAVGASVPFLDDAGIEHSMVSEVGCPYISHARATMLRKALDAGATDIVFLDHDVSWAPRDLLTLLQADGDVVCGTYRYKRPDAPAQYMGAVINGPSGKPMARESDGALMAHSAPAGFLRVTRNAVACFMRAYPDLVYGDPCAPSVDLFNHGAHDGVWYGEDFAFCRRWRDAGGTVWLLPDLNITHWAGDKAYPGNFHEYLLRLPGGALEGKQ